MPLAFCSSRLEILWSLTPSVGASPRKEVRSRMTIYGYIYIYPSGMHGKQSGTIGYQISHIIWSVVQNYINILSTGSYSDPQIESTLSQGSLAEITNQRFSLKYQTFRQLAAAFISGSGLQSVHVLNV